jgi:pilus assembly protein CpaE
MICNLAPGSSKSRKAEPLVVMVTTADSSFQAFQRALAHSGHECQVRRVDDVSAGLARVAGGGVNSVVLDIAARGTLDGFGRIRESAPGLPLLLWSDAEYPGLPAIAAQQGAFGYVTKASDPADLGHLLAGAARKGESAVGGAPVGGTNPSIIAVMGAKGGVGTTTVAMNVAASLTAMGSVILAELRPTFGTVQSVLYPGQGVRGLAQMLEGGPTPSKTSALLWPAPSLPGLRVLFGPQTPEECREIDPAQVGPILRHLAAEADFVVLDLPVGLSPANRSIVAASHHLALVLRPVAACVRLAKLTLNGLKTGQHFPSSIGSVVVKPAADNTFVPLVEIDDALGIPIFKVIPPAPELYAQSERARIPMVQCDPESLLAESFAALARGFQTRATGSG